MRKKQRKESEDSGKMVMDDPLSLRSNQSDNGGSTKKSKKKVKSKESESNVMMSNVSETEKSTKCRNQNIHGNGGGKKKKYVSSGSSRMKKPSVKSTIQS